MKNVSGQNLFNSVLSPSQGSKSINEASFVFRYPGCHNAFEYKSYEAENNSALEAL